MNRTALLAAYVLIGCAAFGSVLLGQRRKSAAPSAASAASASSSAAVTPASALTSVSEAPSASASTEPRAELRTPFDDDRFDRTLDGAPVPDLPESAPERVGLAIALVTYRGAQFAPRATRSREEARALALALAARAQKSFAEAIRLADPGSTADAGMIPRGVLEPAVEHAVFSLGKGAVLAEPLDTPRGYWIVQRIQ